MREKGPERYEANLNRFVRNLAKAEKESSDKTEHIVQESIEAKAKQNDASEQKAKLDVALVEAKAAKTKIQESLADVLPAVEAAKKAVEKLAGPDGAKAIKFIKSLAKPPLSVVLTVEAVLLLLGNNSSQQLSR